MLMFALCATGLLLLGVVSLLLFSPKIQLFGTVINSVKTDKKIIALTFDDGPNEPYTAQLLKVLDTYNAKATFFMVGVNCERFPQAVQAVKASGHEIGMHSYRHEFKRYFTDPFYNNEIACTQHIFNKQSIHPTLFRTPWLFKSPFIFYGLKQYGFTNIIGGVFAHLKEPFNADANTIAGNAIKHIKPGAIIIFHDGYNGKTANRAETVKAVEKVLAYASAHGYTCVTVSSMISGNHKI